MLVIEIVFRDDSDFEDFKGKNVDDDDDDEFELKVKKG